MNATILHESRGRIRLRLKQKRMTLAQADLLEAWLLAQPWTRQAAVHERTCCVILHYGGDRQTGGAAPLFLGGGGKGRRPARPQQPGPEPGI